MINLQGLILYKEQYLIGGENSHPRDVLEILKTTAHELGHQFFGKRKYSLKKCNLWLIMIFHKETS